MIVSDLEPVHESDNHRTIIISTIIISATMTVTAGGQNSRTVSIVDDDAIETGHATTPGFNIY
jgi:ascorbate-specific PTS system EIIC-type component UlaA